MQAPGEKNRDNQQKSGRRRRGKQVEKTGPGPPVNQAENRPHPGKPEKRPGQIPGSHLAESKPGKHREKSESQRQSTFHDYFSRGRAHWPLAPSPNSSLLLPIHAGFGEGGHFPVDSPAGL